MLGELPFREALHEGLVATLAEHGLGPDVLDHWRNQHPHISSSYEWTAWGTIRWDRRVGRPESASLSVAFTVAQRAEWKGQHDAEAPWTTGQADVAHGVLFDLPMDGDAYQVGYVCHSWALADPGDRPNWAQWDGTNFVTAKFTPTVSWVSQRTSVAGPARRLITPDTVPWDAKPDRVFLQPFEVI